VENTGQFSPIRGRGTQVLFIHVCGSTELGLCISDSDIDLVSIINVDRNTFFTAFSEYLRDKPKISYIHIVRATVPLLKIVIEEVDVDLLCVQWPSPKIPTRADFLDLNIFRGLDEPSITSLQGLTTCCHVLDAIPDITVFRTVLHVIRLFCQSRCIYSSALGFWNGVTCALLVSKICINNPDNDAIENLKEFFATYAQWSWFKPIEWQPRDDGSAFDIWKPNTI